MSGKFDNLYVDSTELFEFTFSKDPVVPVRAYVERCDSEPQPTPSAVSSRAEPAPTPEPGVGSVSPAFKGYELYSWQDEAGRWLYALLPGTNRLKSSQEIHNGRIAESELRDTLRKLPPGETVTWCPPPNLTTDIVFALPPDPVVRDLLALAASRRFALSLCSPQTRRVTSSFSERRATDEARNEDVTPQSL
jgi:hypothetical protein